MMFIYVFEPHPEHYDIIGAIVIIAQSHQHAVDVYVKSWWGGKAILLEKLVPLSDLGFEATFVLVSKIPVHADEQPRMVCSNWGYIE